MKLRSLSATHSIVEAEPQYLSQVDKDLYASIRTFVTNFEMLGTNSFSEIFSVQENVWEMSCRIGMAFGNKSGPNL